MGIRSTNVTVDFQCLLFSSYYLQEVSIQGIHLAIRKIKMKILQGACHKLISQDSQELNSCLRAIWWQGHFKVRFNPSVWLTQWLYSKFNFLKFFVESGPSMNSSYPQIKSSGSEHGASLNNASNRMRLASDARMENTPYPRPHSTMQPQMLSVQGQNHSYPSQASIQNSSRWNSSYSAKAGIHTTFMGASLSGLARFLFFHQSLDVSANWMALDAKFGHASSWSTEPSTPSWTVLSKHDCFRYGINR